MAIKQRLLKSIRYATDLLETCDTAVLSKVVASLKDVDILLQVGLTSEYRVQYKEIVDGAESALQNADSKELAEVCSLSKDLLSVAEKQIAGETRFRREIVFLPYKAEMWDSMESVWQAAEADKDHAIAYVVPIPYFDRNPDGSIREWHCDAGKFPHYVPIRDYRSIDLEEMHPDVIVVSNPYDDTNIVTSVHPDYYSRNLKSYTEKLVYIPYFVLEEVDPKDGEALGNISHFVLTLGVYNADLIIVQSEDMRKAYVEILTQLSEVKDRPYWEKRILGLGSPKIDKVLSTKRENVKLPKSWQRIIEKLDGTRKKVIFYNVSLASLLEYEDKLLDKMEWVFGVFRERQGEVALLWRPHPLFVSTLESMKPELLARYRSMVERYRSEGWGIYDDTPELHRSIAISDAYYGDASSVVTMFNAAKKPVVHVIYSSYEIGVPFFGVGCDTVRKVILLVEEHGNLICSFNWEKENVGVYNIPAIEKYYIKDVFFSSDMVYLISLDGAGFIVFDMKTRKWDYSNYKKSIWSTLGKNSRTTAYYSKNECLIYFFIVDDNRIFYIQIYDIRLKKYELISVSFDVEKKINEFFSKNDRRIVRFEYCVLGNVVYLLSRPGNLLITFDMTTHFFDAILLSDERYWSIDVLENTIWFAGENSILRWKDGTYKEIHYTSDFTTSDRNMRMCILNDTMYLFGLNNSGSTQIIRYNITLNKFSVMLPNNKIGQVVAIYPIDRKIIISSVTYSGLSQLSIIDTEEDTIRYHMIESEFIVDSKKTRFVYNENKTINDLLKKIDASNIIKNNLIMTGKYLYDSML